MGCSTENSVVPNTTNPKNKLYRYLALGDSYTIGQSVCASCRFPEQLQTKLKTAFLNDIVSLKTIATTGWTTTQLIAAINLQNPSLDANQ